MSEPTRAICFRVTQKYKDRIESAARRVGKNLTGFLIQAVDSAVAQAEATNPVADTTHQGVPAYFRARCMEATQGGEWGYKGPAYELCRHLREPSPYELDEDQWDAELQKLADLLLPSPPGQPDKICTLLREDDAILAWFDEHFPKCMALIPRRRRQQFLAGVLQALEDEIIDL